MTKFERALQIWSLLTSAARNRRTYTYADLATAIGMPRAQQAVGSYLGPVQSYCQQNHLPPLTVLVVLVMGPDAGRPGAGYAGPRETLDRDRERVYDHDWSGRAPSLDDFRKAWNGRDS